MQYPAHERLRRVLAKGMLESAHVRVSSHRLRDYFRVRSPLGSLWLYGCAQGYAAGCAGSCPAFPPGIGIMVLVEAGSPGKSSPAGLRSRTDSCPAVPDGVLLPEL